MQKSIALIVLLIFGFISCGCTLTQQPAVMENHTISTSTPVSPTAIITLQTNPGNAPPTLSPELASYRKGLDLYQKGDYLGAIDAFNDTISLNKTNSQAYFARGKAFYQIGKNKWYEMKGNEEFNQAISDFGVVLGHDMNPDNIREVWILRGYSNLNIAQTQFSSYAEKGKHSFSYFDEAATDFSYILETNPNDVDALIGRSIAYSYVGRGSSEVKFPYNESKCEIARKDAQRAVELAPDNGWAHFAVFMVKDNIDKLPRSELTKELDKAITDDPGEAWFYYTRGNVKKLSDDYDGSRSDYLKAIELQPTFAGAYNQLAGLDQLEGKHEDALVHAQKALEINPNIAWWWTNFAAYQVDLCDDTISCYEQALNSYDRSIAIDPELLISHYERWWVLMSLQRIPEAQEEIRIIRTFDSADPKVVNYMQRYTDNYSGGINVLRYG